MKQVTRYQTSDGALHDDDKQAKRYAENRYGLALSCLAHAAVQQIKYSHMLDFIDSKLADFVALQALKDDCAVEPTQKDDAP